MGHLSEIWLVSPPVPPQRFSLRGAKRCSSGAAARLQRRGAFQLLSLVPRCSKTPSATLLLILLPPLASISFDSDPEFSSAR